MIASLPSNESARLEALRRFRILDTPPEPAFDKIAQLAAYICQTPIALVSLVDEKRQWFKSAIGLDTHETSRDDAFCAHALLTPDELMVVPNAILDERFADNPLVTGAPRIRFYAGAPLVTSEGHALGTLCVIDHVPRELTSAQKEALCSLRRSVISELELRRHIVQWKALGEELARIDHMKEEFLANMAHELRTPLNAVLGFSEVLGAELHGRLNEKQAHVVRMIEDSGRHLLALVNDSLDLAKINAGKLDIKREVTSISQVCSASLAMVSNAAQAKAITMSETRDPRATNMLVDPRRLKQILVNLLSNAIKFTPRCGRVGLTVKVDPENHHITFAVWDTGIGIDASQIEQIFQPFVQLDSSLARQSEGTGLGLSLVDRLAKLMDGVIDVKSQIGKGSQFSVSFPWEPPRW